ncbi:adenosine kinase, putative [Leishmania panamensis]|uniref:Adenosine kinase n=3 Tax=Leishmania guyanensis species complex TaxID=38579 RepID=A0A088SEU8_LEIPA|nr:adenosine kinase, putative [Leishmania panamensis]AIO00327.1 adenosine kinase, putative [Leishmania panamensis]CCM17488.1 adenosine kinase, putative [Leishmania guyanensis]
MSALPRLYVQCNPLLDVSASVDDAFFEKYKVKKACACLMEEAQKGIFEDLEQQPNVAYVPGGSGLNTARVAQWIAQAPNSSFVNYVGCVSDDRYGNILKDAAEKDGVSMHLEYTTKAPTGSCAVCISGKERSLVANLSAANLLSTEHMLSSDVVETLKGCQLYYLTGFTLTIDVSYVLQVAEAARASGGQFMMNLSAPFLLQYFTEGFNKAVPYLDVLFGNEVEAKVLADVMKWDLTDVSEIARRAATELPYNGTRDRLVVFTQGSEKTVYATRSGKTGSSVVHPVEQDSIVDLNGAGDAFVGGFLATYAMGRSIERCCEVGNYAAGVIIQHNGCTYPEKALITP